MKLRLPVLVLSAAIALSLTACTGGAPDANPAAGSNRPAESASTEPAVEEAKSTNSVFGETYTYTDGLSVTIGAPQPLTPGEYAATGEEPNFLSFDVTVVNGTDGNYDPALFYVTLQSANAEAGGVYDVDINNNPQTSLLPGREVTWKIGYGVLDTNDLVMEVTPGVEYQSRIFTK
ncbi:hypothetical protein MT344_04100 [Clavibacter michiganensis subsp. phaseoli]|uniref:hypothetical protein n=1 Tax=Clavibacter phaseoli TaxID=1734031 RepID=UPI001FB3309A|nr:hypothetical protein [Clavibacter phaseoli]MCJ1710365.1 hypothetical protein [Clavibacter phaseoli]